jgi:NAD(P)H-flavin reductase
MPLGLSSFIFFVMNISALSVNGFMFNSLARMKSTVRVDRVLRMSDQEGFWTKAKVISNVAEATGIRKIEFDVDSKVLSEFRIPGQYVQIRSGESKPGFYAIASPPRSEKLTFIVKETENNAYISKASPADTLDLSMPQGRGFQIEEYFERYKFDFPVTSVLLMACGTGLAPIASAIESEVLGIGGVGFNSIFPRKAKLYIGARTEAHLPLKDKYALWKERGVEIIPVLSQAPDSWSGERGYIQNALQKDGIEIPRNTGTLLCGHRLDQVPYDSYL